MDSALVEIPDVLVDEETQTMIDDFRNRLSQQGFTLEQYFQITGQSLEELSAQMRVDALGKVKVRLVLDALANAEKIEVKAEDVEEEYATIAKNYSMDIEKVKQLASVETIAYDVRLRKAYDFIFDNLA